jgi:ATP-dependent Lhr-like helicase
MGFEAMDARLVRWFRERLGEPTQAQRQAWEAIARGDHTLLAAPTGSGKTLAAFAWFLSERLRGADAAAGAGAVDPDGLVDARERGDSAAVSLPAPAGSGRSGLLYISPLKALSNDIGKNLLRPIEELRAAWPELPEIHVAVRTGDTSGKARAAMARRPPDVLVTTPESFYILLTSAGGRRLLSGLRSVVIDEIHALAGTRRGAHLALSLERLEALIPAPIQRIGLSATQRPIEAVAELLGGVGRPVTVVDAGHRRQLDLSVWVPPSPLAAVQSHEVWGEVHDQLAELVRQHRTTLVFVNTRKVCERTARELARRLAGPADAADRSAAPEAAADASGALRVLSHHSSLSLERRLEAEERLKRGELRALVATSSLELGIDVGEIDLVVQIGSARRIATLLQRVGRAGHGVGRIPKGILFPQSQEELTEAAALLLAVRTGELDRLLPTRGGLDVLAQQIVAECAAGDQEAHELLARFRRAAPYRDLSGERFEQVLALHSGQRLSLLHVDPASGRLRATRRAALIALSSGGAIPDKADYRVVQEPEGLTVGSVDEDFAVESSAGDVFQLGNMSWRILRTEPGVMRVVDAAGAPPSLPFWFGEAPARSAELSALMGLVRRRGLDPLWLERELGLDARPADELRRYLSESLAALGCLPHDRQLVLERFPDRSGGAQLVLHALFGSRINRAFGLALRKRFCRHFGFELQAAANEESILISLGPVHSFPLDEVPGYLAPRTVGATLRQAVLASPLFQTRWRWNAGRSLRAPRAPGGKRLPAPLLRMRADDLLAEAFPDVVACGENLPAGDLEIPVGHPLLDQTLEDCLHEALDLAGLERVLEELREGAIAVQTVERGEPSPMAKAALAIGPYGFLDDAGLEERRSHAVAASRGAVEAPTGPLPAELVAQVRAEAWPDPRDGEELHEILGWMGFVTAEELERNRPWKPWIEALRGAGRVERRDGPPVHFALTGASREPLELWRGRLEALGPFRSAAPELLALEAEGLAVRIDLDDGQPGPQAWCHRRLHARILRLSRDQRRQRVRPLPFVGYLRFLCAWHGLDEASAFEGPEGLRRALQRLAGWEAPAPDWERALLPARLPGYRPELLDPLTLSGEVAWGRLWGSSLLAPRSTPIALFPREQLELWLELAGPVDGAELSWPARALLEALERRGALFRSDLERLPGLLPSDVERGLDELLSRGLLCADTFAALRPLLWPAAKRQRLRGPRPPLPTGRFGLFRPVARDAAADGSGSERGAGLSTRPGPPREASLEPLAWPVARVLLERYGVLFRALLEHERQPLPWRELQRALRLAELRGDAHGGRFVEGFAGEQFAHPAALTALGAAAQQTRNPFERLDTLDPADPLAQVAKLLPGRSSPAAPVG